MIKWFWINETEIKAGEVEVEKEIEIGGDLEAGLEKGKKTDKKGKNETGTVNASDQEVVSVKKTRQSQLVRKPRQMKKLRRLRTQMAWLKRRNHCHWNSYWQRRKPKRKLEASLCS